MSAFMNPPEYVGRPDESHAPATRRFQGIASMAVSPGGRMWATWYAGSTPGEDQNNYVVLSASDDRGETWTERLIVDPDGPGPVRAFDPQLWADPTARLWFTWTQAVGHDGSVAGVWAMTTSDAGAAEPAWSEPRRLTDGVMMGKALVLSTGEWALPVSTWRTTDNSARMVVSQDQGQTWDVRGACHVPPDEREFDEHMIVERADGSLWMLVRTKYGIGGSVSHDRGATWSALEPSRLQHPSSRFFIRRLASGALLLVKHGLVDERTARSHLRAFVSRDDGRSWRGELLIDERVHVSYPDGQQADDGTIHVVYDYARTKAGQITVASFREEDVERGGEVVKRVVSDLT